MFNNPFESFHDTVAEAKEEREQLDRLLTVSTPRERLLVAAIAVVLLVLAAWLFLGSVPRSLAVDGVLIGSGEGLFVDDGSVQARIRVKRDTAAHIAAGMPAAIESDGAADILGEVATITPLPFSEGLAAIAGSASEYRIGIAVDADLDLPSPSSRACRIVIEVGRQTPAALFGLRRP